MNQKRPPKEVYIEINELLTQLYDDFSKDMTFVTVYHLTELLEEYKGDSSVLQSIHKSHISAIENTYETRLKTLKKIKNLLTLKRI